MKVDLTLRLDGSLKVEYEWHIYRVLFSDGRTVDVEAVWDSSDVRDAVLAWAGGGDLRIEGVARLPEQEALL